MSRDPIRDQIERSSNAPVISYDWGAGTVAPDWEPDPSRSGLLLPPSATRNGLIEEWNKVRDKIKRRRSKAPTDSEMFSACEEALGLVKFITDAGVAGAIHGNWCPSHAILAAVANIYEARKGRINPLVQAVIREAMDEVYVEERMG